MWCDRRQNSTHLRNSNFFWENFTEWGIDFQYNVSHIAPDTAAYFGKIQILKYKIEKYKIEKYKMRNANTKWEIQIEKYKLRNTNWEIQLEKYKLWHRKIEIWTNISSEIQIQIQYKYNTIRHCLCLMINFDVFVIYSNYVWHNA